MNRLMKNSDLGYLGMVPSDWPIEKLKGFFCVSSVKNRPEATVLSLYRDYGIVPKDSRSDNHNVTSSDTSNYKFVEVGDFVINKMKGWQGSMALSKYEGIVSPAYHVFKFKNGRLLPRYAHYLLRNKSYADEWHKLSTGLRVGQWDLHVDDFLKTMIPVPPLDEQQRIANYLDDKCGQIDCAIQAAKDSIEEYKTYRARLIHEAVFHGINNGYGTKDYKWVSHVREQFRNVRLKDYANFSRGNQITKAELRDSGKAIINYGQIHSKLNSGVHLPQELIRFAPEDLVDDSTVLRRNDLLLATTSEDRAALGTAMFIDSDEELYPGGDSMVCRLHDVACPKYVAYQFLTDAWRNQLRIITNGIKVFHVTQKRISTVNMVLPPDNEQRQIVDYLDGKCMEIAKSITVKQSIIDDLKKYKQSLVYEVVTGKKEV